MRFKAELTRRSFLQGSAAVAAGGAFAPFASLAATVADGRPLRTAGLGQGGYGPIKPAAELNGGGELLALPEGFRYVQFGLGGSVMSDGHLTPQPHDGMAAFAMDNGHIRLVRNHEVRDDSVAGQVIGDASLAYDPRAGGGCTSLEVRVRADGVPELVRDFVAIAGTHTNCAGGPTPWGSWLTCEEITQGSEPYQPGSGPNRGRNGFGQPHGYVFEIPAGAESQVQAVPLKAMGRFTHEAAAVDPMTGIVYLTEDNGDSGFYRFLPNVPGKLVEGGRLQMLAVRRPNYDTKTGQTLRRALPCVWVDIPDPDPADAASNPDAVYDQGLARGGAIFARLEGCWYHNGSIFFTSTSGGEAGEGQVWEYRPAGASGGYLRLVFESPAENVLDNPDNITVSKRGGIVLCEDGDADRQFLRGLTRDGRIFDFAQNLFNSSEWAGATFSPDGRILFANVQGSTRLSTNPSIGRTFAIWGPWELGAL